MLKKTVYLLENNNECIFPDSPEYKDVHIETLQSQRKLLLEINRDHDDIDEMVLRQHLIRLDLDEERLRYL
ncbi:MAG: hypothetical protein WDN75_08985 [Bacteroidota bacterium]